MNRNWYNTYPKRVNGLDLVGKKLGLTSKPPEDTSFGGMKVVVVKDLASSKEYSVMMTERDIGEAVDLFVFSGSACFTFQPDENLPDKYAQVTSIKKPKEGQ